ncbi:MAG TPA: PKD domain-containing protein, partial [Phaeodactylibacter sp.]|nr:PKD domain-containing protein [Phaeodactylibacter sp.]
VIYSSQFSEVFFDSTYALLPGWVRGNGTPDMWPNEQGDNHVLHLVGNNSDDRNLMEGVVTFAPTAANQNYLASFWAEEPFKSPPFPTPTVDNFRTPFISLINLSEFTPGDLGDSSDPMYSGPEQRVFNTELITGDSIVRRGALVCANDNYDGVWVSGSNQFPSSGAIVDNVEIIPDEFTAGDSIFSPLCNQQYLLGGQQFCMLSDVGVEYEWSRVEDDGTGGEQLVQLGTYRVLNGTVVNRTGLVDSSLQVEVAPAITTTYRLTRTIYDYGGLPTDFEFSKEMPDGTIVSLDSDDVTVVVQEGLPDASFTWEETGCGTGIFNLTSNDDDLSTTHAWFLDDGPTPFSTSADPTLGPLANGQYTVRHEASNICGTVRAEETIVVDIPPVPSPVLSIAAQNCNQLGYPVTFDVENLNPEDVVITYEYGDETGNANGATIYMAPGTYTAVVTVANSCGITTTDSVVVDVGPAPDPGATLVITPTGECGGYTFATGEAHPDFDYSWDFGDGTTSTETSPTHDYGTQGGNFQVTLTLEGECGGVYTYTQNLAVPECLDVDTYTCEDCNTATTIGQAGQTTSLSSILTPGQHSGLLYCVEGTLVIQSGENYSFGNSVFRMGEGARIVVAPSGSLLANNTVFHGCSTLWRGIEVLKGGRLELKAGNILSDAQYGVYIHPNPDANGPVTDVFINRNRFVANFVGIYTADEGAGAEADLLIAGNRFDVYASTDELLPPFSGQTSGPEGMPNANLYPLAGIYVQPMASVFASTGNSFRRLASGVVIHENPAATVSFDAYEEMDAHAGAYPSYAYAGHALNAQGNGAGMLSAIDNEIKNCSHGIVSNQLSLEARDNTINTVDFGIQVNLPNFGSVQIGESGTAISNTIKAARIGVQVRAFDQNATVNIQRNSISTYSAGATAALEMGINLASTTVEDNLITVEQAGSGISTLWVNNSSFLDNTITLSDPTSAEAGMHFVFTRNCRVQGNTVNGAGTGGGQNYGMHIDFSPSNAYCNNTFDNTRYGTLVTGVSDAENNFKCNTFQEHSVGLQLNQSFFGLSRIGTQVHQSNCWSASSGGAVWDGVDFLTAQTYPFEVDPTVMACFLPPSVMPAQGWFDPVDDGGTSISCGTNTCEPDDFNHESDDAHKIAQGQVGGGDYAASVTWMLQQYLYKRGYGKPIDSLTIQAFFNTHAHRSLGQFYNLDQQLKQLFLSTPTEVADMDGFLQQLKGGLALLRALDQALLQAAESEWDSLLDNRHQTANELLPVTDSIAFAHSQIVHNRTNGMAALLTQNAGITAQAVYEINERFFNDALFRYLERGSTYLTSTELQRLQAIATQCPLSGGWPVFKARALLYVVTGQQG